LLTKKNSPDANENASNYKLYNKGSGIIKSFSW
jgi:hypothetical protein